MRSRTWIVLSCSATAGLFALGSCGDEGTPPEPAESAWVGAQTCSQCHAAELSSWSGSHHDLAMQVANPVTVLGDFDDASFTHFGVTTEFERRGGDYFVRTEGPDGRTQEYQVAYVFGVDPLQQYLIEFPGGRYQVLGTCWDARPATEGGQRWFHLYPDEHLPPDHELHWTGPNQNWNFMCAECHSTNLQMNFDVEANAYATTWSEIDVSCEACHGPGREHVEWARLPESRRAQEADMRLAVRLRDTDDGEWIVDPETQKPRRSVRRESRAELEACARCHSRRSVIASEYEHGLPLMDTHRPAQLTEGLYHADGQILEEVYVYGSFLQSKMYREGVTCTDCHDAHRLGLIAEDNALCVRCHLPDAYDTPEHHFHEPGTPGASCVECHMPAKDYMVVDPRRDHRFGIPRPDQTLALGTPNACQDCHADRPPEWAADFLAERKAPPADFAAVLHAGREGTPGADARLIGLLRDDEAPGIARATAATLLLGQPSPRAVEALQKALRDEEPAVREAAVMALELLPPPQRAQHIAPLVDDPVRAVRIAAARMLAEAPANTFPPELVPQLERSLDEYVDAQNANADRAGSHVNLGVLALAQGQPDEAEKAYRTALRIQPRFAAASVNLAELLRNQERNTEAEAVLREALVLSPKEPALHHALGLHLVRGNRQEEALEELESAAVLAPDDPAIQYVLGIALNSTGQGARAVAVLQKTLADHPHDRQLLYALATILRDNGDPELALGYAERIQELTPWDPRAGQLVDSLRAEGGG